MRTFRIALLLLAVATGLAAQTRQRVVGRGAAGVIDGPWSLEIVSTGGITGGGFGDIRITSDGKLVVGQFVPNGKTCELLLLQNELASLFQTVKALRASAWVSSYIPADTRAMCCDVIFLTVTLTRTEQDPGSSIKYLVTYRTQMISFASNIPGDLAGLRALLLGDPDGYLTRYQHLCFPLP